VSGEEELDLELAQDVPMCELPALGQVQPGELNLPWKVRRFPVLLGVEDLLG
jgi:hypothetical protein